MITLLYNRGKGESEHLNTNIRMFEANGIKCIPFRTTSSILLKNKVDILYLNWYENIYNGHILIAVGQVILKTITVQVAKLRGTKVVVSQHNRCQHDARHQKLSNWMFRYVFRKADKIIEFSKGGHKDLISYINADDVEKKAVYIPPVNYIGVYPFQEQDWITELEDSSVFTVCMVGSLNHPYKNVKLVMEIAKDMVDLPVRFIFAGKLGEDKKKEYTIFTDGFNNIINVFRFIKDDEMAQLLDISDVIIMPYDVQSISNSGTARLAFSYGKTVICPRVPSLEDIPCDLIYSYDYPGKNKHKDVLKAETLRAFSDFQESRERFEEKGIKLKEIMQSFNSPEIVSRKYMDLFSELLK